MIFRPFFVLSLAVSFATVANSEPNLKELLDGAEQVNDLVGPFGERHNWDQYVDAQTAKLEFRFQGNVYDWRDIHGRVSFFEHGKLRHAAESKGMSAVDTDDFTSSVVLVDDSGTFYVAGWRNFADNDLSVFSIAPVDTGLLNKVADKLHIAPLAEDQGLSIILQRNSEKQRAGKFGIDIQPRLGRETDVKHLADTFSSPERHVDWLKKYLFPTEGESGTFKLSATPEMLYALNGCDIEELGPELFESPFTLSSLGTCFYSKSGIAKRYPDLPAPYTLWYWLNDQVAANPISVGPHPSELSDDSARKTRYTAVSGHADASVWTSWSDYPKGNCKAGRDISKGDWVVVNYEFERTGGYNYFSQFDEGALKRYPDQFHYALNGGSVPWFKSGKCDFPKSISISLYYNGDIISQSFLTESFVKNYYSNDSFGASLSRVLSRRDYLNEFLHEEVGADIWRYAENLR